MAEAIDQSTAKPHDDGRKRRQRYQLTVGADPKFVWFRNAKVGTRTLYWLLKEAPVEFAIEHEYSVLFNPEQLHEHFKFAMVRNPWDRFVSGWHDKIVKGKAGFLKLSAEDHKAFCDLGKFAEFIARQDLKNFNVHFRPQSALIDLNAVDYIGRFENFEAEIGEIFGVLGLTTPESIPRKNRSARPKPYQDYYTKETSDLIEEIYRKDIKMFGYKFEGS